MEFQNRKLEDFNNNLSGKKIAIVGIGVSNIPLLDYFHQFNVELSIFDKKDEKEISKDLKNKINKYKIRYFGGENNLENLKGYDIIFRSPSIMPYREELQAEADRGAIITTEIELVIELAPCKVIGVTGTEGKTTTTTIIYEIMKKAGYRCFLGGNMGNPIFNQIKDMTPEDVVILELSSFQLIGMNVSPDISLVTNVFPDHLNVHRSFDEYKDAKKNIFIHQKENGIVVLNYDNEITRDFANYTKNIVKFFSSKQILQNGYFYDTSDGYIKQGQNNEVTNIMHKSEIQIRGVHNYENICAALAMTDTLVARELQVEAIRSFKGVEHRLEFVRELNGVKWYNDSIGTSPASTIAGLKAFEENIILLAGGSEKGLDYTEIGEVIAEKVGTLILCGPTSAKIEEATRKGLERHNKDMEIYYAPNLEEEVKIAYSKAKEGDVVLLSPASASFDAFKNFDERGKRFKEFVNNL